MLAFNDFIGPETLSREYKEFCLHKTGIPFDIKQVEDLLYENRFEFDSLVLQNLEKYIQQYIPKYVCAFWNSNISGEMVIGTDDYGFIKGIPLTSELDVSWVKECIRHTIETSIQSDGKKPDVHVEITRIENPILQTGLHPQFQYYLDKKREFELHYQEFLDVYKEWQDMYELVNIKLVDIVNQPMYRAVLKDYMERHEGSEIALATLLDQSYELPYLSGEEIRYMKWDPSSVFYWVTRLKDEMCVQYRKDKPYFFPKFRHRNIPYNLIIGLGDMIPYWSDQIDLYLIRIRCDIIPSRSDYQYYNGTQWIRCVRVMEHDQPTCLPE
jgi:hypothetical protein